MAKTFTHINDQRLVEIIRSTEKYLILASPSVSLDVAREIIEYRRRIPTAKLRIVLDVDAEPIRLGFGSPESIKLLHENSIDIGKAAGLRIGVLVADENAWVFTPTPEIILRQPDETLSNAVAVSTDFALEMVPAVSPEIAIELNILEATVLVDEKFQSGEFCFDREIPNPKEPEIGKETASASDVVKVERSIAENPPVKFDHERHLRVYKGYFQFVDFHYVGGNVATHTITIPGDLLNIAQEDNNLRSRIRSTCRLVDQANPFAQKFAEFRQKVDRLRKDYSVSLGKRYGSIILRKMRPEFDAKVEKLRSEMGELTKNVQTELQAAIDENRDKLVELLLPGFVKNPPTRHRSRSLLEITEETAPDLIRADLATVIPGAEKLIGNMQLDCDYKEMTYEMVTDKDFIELVKKRFNLDLETIHSEETAAGERNSRTNSGS